MQLHSRGNIAEDFLVKWAGMLYNAPYIKEELLW